MRRLYWVKEGLKCAANVLGATFLYSVFMNFFDSGTGGMGALRTGAVYLLLFGSIMSLVFNITLYQTQLPLVISLGCGRKEALVGLLLYRLAALVPVAAVTGVLTMMIDPQLPISVGSLVVLEISVYILCTCAGGFVGTLVARVSRIMLGFISAGVMILILALFGGAMVVFFVVGMTDALGWMMWVIPCAAAGVYGLCRAAESRALRRFCVR